MLPKDLPEPASPCLSSQGSPVKNRAATLQSGSSALWVPHWAGGKALGVRAGSFRPRLCDPICLVCLSRYVSCFVHCHFSS